MTKENFNGQPTAAHSPVARALFLGTLSFIMLAIALSKSKDLSGDNVQLFIGLAWLAGLGGGLISMQIFGNHSGTKAASNSKGVAFWLILIATLVSINVVQAFSETIYRALGAFVGGCFFSAMIWSIRRDLKAKRGPQAS